MLDPLDMYRSFTFSRKVNQSIHKGYQWPVSYKIIKIVHNFFPTKLSHLLLSSLLSSISYATQAAETFMESNMATPCHTV